MKYQDVVAERVEGIVDKYWGKFINMNLARSLETDINETLTQLVKEVEDGEYKSGVEQTIVQFLRMNLENPKMPVNVDEVKRRALSERV